VVLYVVQRNPPVYAQSVGGISTTVREQAELDVNILTLKQELNEKVDDFITRVLH